ncbi:MAG: peptidylprolyl isomerase [Nitrosomonadaceae bacterium]|nr:peptidylprolyl isomerase [Nitrosomonadaceae bacterium]
MGTSYSPRLLVLLLMLMAEIAVAQQVAHIGSIAPIDRIIAVVNEEVITQKELDEMLRHTIRQLQTRGVQAPAHDVLEKQLLERFIVNRLQLQMAKETGLTVSDNDLDDTLRRIAKENKMSLPELYAALERDGVNFNKFRDEIRNELILMRLKDREVNNRITVTEDEVDNFLHSQETSGGGVNEYRLAHILVQVPERAEPAQIEVRYRRAEAALAKLKSGAEFAQVAAEFSDAADAMKGGVLDWRPSTQLPTKFAEVLASMQPGGLTPVIQSSNGFYIFKLLERRGQQTATVIITQTQARHILVKTNELTSMTDAQRRILDLKERLDNGASFQELAKLHSEDASASSGGSLGWISPGDTVPAFEQAMDALQPGQVSEPVQSPFGWHLIQVIERRTQDVSNERQRQTARRTIHARKADTAFEEWLQRLRDRAYVEYRLEER